MFVVVSEMFGDTQQGQGHVLSASGLQTLASNVPPVGVLPALHHLHSVAHVVAGVLILLEEISADLQCLRLINLQTGLASLEAIRSVPVSNTSLALLALHSRL